MDFKINDIDITKPIKFHVDISDIEDSDSSMTMSDGSYVRDIIATKRELDIEFGLLSWGNCSKIMGLIANPFFYVYYPDPLTGQYERKEFYVKNRKVPYTTLYKGEIFWQGLSVTLNER